MLLIDKPVGCTSFDVVRNVGRTMGTRKCGHTGTLDPFASGLLCLCFGEATKAVNVLMAGEKEYVATLALGTETDSGDIDGTPTLEADVPGNIGDLLQAALPRFMGMIEQTPPVYSAIKVNGKRLYEYARNGESVEIPSRVVHVEELELLRVDEKEAVIRVVCGKGTYIRSLCRDLARAVGTCGHLIALRRTRLGDWMDTDAVLSTATEEELLARLMSSSEALTELPVLHADDELARRIGFGQRIPEEEFEHTPFKNGTFVARNNEGHLLALCRLLDGVLKVERGFQRPW